jgi:flagellar P-ring protein precursor FlgI
LSSMTISLNNPDFTTAYRMAATINKHFGQKIASAVDSASIKLSHLPKNAVSFLMNVEQLAFQPDQIARVVIDEQNGVIVMGHRVKIMPLAICHGTITIRIHEQPVISQPEGGNIVISNNNNGIISGGGGGQTVFTQDTDVNVQESQGGFSVLESGAYLDEFVGALNLLGVSPREMVAILQTIKASGALQAELIFA